MKVLVIGATGATGRLAVDKLLERGVEVVAIVRRLESLPDRSNLVKIKASVHDLLSTEIAGYLKDCQGVVSCLGHNVSFKGLFGAPRLLVTETLMRVCEAILLNNANEVVKVVLMNTVANCNSDIPETPPLSQRIVVAILRALLPPQLDNEKAADYLRAEIGQAHSHIQWVVVRPDGLINTDSITEYSIHASPTRNAIFNAGKTSRVNVGHFMAELLVKDDLWQQWKGQMPAIYNQT